MTHRLLPAALAALMLFGSSPLVSAEGQAIQPADPQLGRAVEFYKDVFPIIESKCLACHNVKVKESDLILENAAAMLKGGASGPAVVPGKPDDSLLFQLAARGTDSAMPPLPNKADAKAVTPRELGILRKWIEEGAQAGSAPPAATVANWQPVPESVKSVFSVSLSPDRRYVAAGRANRIALYDIALKKQVGLLTDPALLSVLKDGQPLYGPGTAHRDFVHSLAFNPTGTLLASGSYREVKLWERPTNVQTVKIEAGAPILASAVNPDGTRAALVLGNNIVRLVDLSTGQTVADLTHPQPVAGAAFSADGATVATVGQDPQLRLWKAADGAAIAASPLPAAGTAVCFNKDATQVIVGHADNVLRIWAPPAPPADPNAAPAEPPKPIREMPGHGAPAATLVRMPATNEVLSGSQDGTIRIWNLDNGSQPFNQNLGGPVLGIGVSADGQFVAGGSVGMLAKVWNRNGQQRCEIKGDPALAADVVKKQEDLAIAKSRAALTDTAVKEQEKDVMGREESLKKSNEAKPVAEKVVTDQMPKVTDAEGKLKAAEEALAAKPDDEALKKAKTDAEANLKKERDALQVAKDGVVSADRAITLATQSLENAKTRLTELKALLETRNTTSKQTEEATTAATTAAGQSAKPIRALALSNDGLLVATAGDDPRIQMWDATTGQHLETFAGHTAAVSTLAFATDGTLLSTGADQLSFLWDVQPGFRLVATLGPAPANPLDVSQSAFVDRVLTLAFSPDGTLLATGGGEPSRSGELQLWNVSQRTQVRVFPEAHSDTIYDLEFSREGDLLVTGAADKFVKVFRVADGTHVRSFEGHTNHVLGVAFKADGSALASAGADNALKVWNFETGEQIRTIQGYTKQITSVGYIGATDNLVSCGGDKTVRFHTAGNGGNYRNFAGGGDYMYSVVATPDESLVIASGEDGVVRIWNGKNGQEVVKFDPPAPAATASTP